MMSQMGERAVIEATDTPRTRVSMAADLRALGVTHGGVVLVHTALSQLGWVCGGPVALAQALLDALGPAGTLVVPTHTTGNSDPAHWENPPVPEAWWPVVRAHMPVFDPQITPSHGVGVLPEVVRNLPGALRSAHPQTSFAAIGPHAERITAGHTLENGLGEGSPLARLYELDAEVLLLGVGHASNTSLHLAEYRVREPRKQGTGAAVSSPAGRRWVAYDDVDHDSDVFEAIGAAFDGTGRTGAGRVGSAYSRLLRQREAVDFAVEWLERDRA
jgi:aminoglycoside 3-N-acetyltransferase